MGTSYRLPCGNSKGGDLCKSCEFEEIKNQGKCHTPTYMKRDRKNDSDNIVMAESVMSSYRVSTRRSTRYDMADLNEYTATDYI
jgi:hypothetical protein